MFEPQRNSQEAAKQDLEALDNKLSRVIVDSAFKVHDTLGPGLLESVYEACLAHELRRRGVSLLTQVAIPVVYDTVEIDCGVRLDILVENRVVVEIKSTLKMHPVFEAQLHTYLKLSKLRLGLLINFNVSRIKDGITRIVY
jgi:GxxExxY protein